MGGGSEARGVHEWPNGHSHKIDGKGQREMSELRCEAKQREGGGELTYRRSSGP